MKKLIAVLLVVCLVFAGAIGYISHKNDQIQAGEASPAPVETPAAEASAQPITIKTLDYDLLYAKYEPEQPVVTIGEEEVTWEEYFYMLFTQARQVTDYFSAMASYYGIAQNWDDFMDEEGTTTYAQFVVDSTESALTQLAAIERFARENGVALTEENAAALEEQRKSDIAATCGADGTEEDFEEYLSTIYMTRELYDRINMLNQLYQQNYIQIYGENGELYSDEAALKYLKDGQYISAGHILLMTTDPATGQALDEDAAAEKKASAEKIAAELQAIEDPEALLARFAELKQEYCEDTGKTSFPDGYTFTPGTMVAEFEDACSALAEYQVSEPVKSSFGYHVIIRLPLDVDKVMEYSEDGTALSARSIAANAEYGSRLQSVLDTLSLSYVEGFEKINILDYLK